MHKSKLNYLIRKAKSARYDEFDSVRVENFGKYLVFRIGNYNSYKKAMRDVKKIRLTTKDAYAKRCNFVRENMLFIKNGPEEKVEQVVYEKRLPKKVKKHKKISKKLYTTKRELTYTYKNRNDSLWGDCKKCFIPIYEEEDNSAYENTSKPIQKKIKQKKEIRVEVTEPVVTTKSFWAEETSSSKVKSRVIKKRRIKKRRYKNKFNIDEQFLP